MAGSCLPLLPRSGWGNAIACDRTTWYRDAKFGMFIHWGPYSQASVEASWPIMVPKPGGISEAEYRALPQTFNPVKFDPQAFVDLGAHRYRPEGIGEAEEHGSASRGFPLVGNLHDHQQHLGLQQE